MIAWIRFVLTAALVIPGLIVCCIGVYGMFRFDYAANRMHAAALIDTMGIALCVVGLAISAPDVFSALKLLLVAVFWWISSPVSSHLLCRLEIVTDEQRDEYMVVHRRSLAQERGEDAAQPAEQPEEVTEEEPNEEQTEVEQP